MSELIPVPITEVFGEPLYLTQGSIIFINSGSGDQLGLTWKEIQQAYEGDGVLGQFQIRTKHSCRPSDPTGQPNAPWYIPLHGCVIAGLKKLPPNFKTGPASNILVAKYPPMVIGPGVQVFGLDVARRYALDLELQVKVARVA